MKTNTLLSSLISIFSLVSTQAAYAQSCPTLVGNYMCGPKGGVKNLRLNIRTEGSVYNIHAGSQPPFEVIADRQDRKGVLGSADKKADYRAFCEDGKMNLDFRMPGQGPQKDAVLMARDSYYAEGGGLVRVRVHDARSELKGAPSVISCSPIIEPRTPPPAAQ